MSMQLSADFQRPHSVQIMLESRPDRLIASITALLDRAGFLTCDRSAEAELSAVRAFHHNHFVAMRCPGCHAADAFSKGMLCMVAKHLSIMV